MAFKIQELVHHRHSGVCRVTDISTLSSMPNGPEYYVLQPLFGEDKGTIVRVPTTNTVSLAPILSKEVAFDLVENWPKGDNLYEADAKKRKQNYESAIASGEYLTFPRLLEGIRQKKAKEGKLNSMDQQFLSRAQPILYGEIASALGVQYEDVDGIIHK
ncbi:MAG: CarD family transcriptional regulator [Bacillota bacterium]|nr:CarD family transcriptional regulator [Bacillota bacterium]